VAASFAGRRVSETGLDEPLRECNANLDAVDRIDRIIADLVLRESKYALISDLKVGGYLLKLSAKR
jgi:hypothetical protein